MNLYPTKIKKNDRKANIYIWSFSAFIFIAITLLEKLELHVNLGFDPHIFAMLSAITNGMVALLLIWALLLVRKGDIDGHRKVMESAMYLSVFFLLFYVLHHLFTGSTLYGDMNHDGEVTDSEKAVVGKLRYLYYFIISTHITLAGIVMPFVLFSAYRALTGEIAIHRKLVKYTFPIWLYVAITGVIVYLMISPYYV